MLNNLVFSESTSVVLLSLSSSSNLVIFFLESGVGSMKLCRRDKREKLRRNMQRLDGRREEEGEKGRERERPTALLFSFGSAANSGVINSANS